MSQLDLQTQLRRARPVAPAELRERVRLVAGRAPKRRRRLTWRLGAVIAFAAAFAVVAAVVATRDNQERTTAPAHEPATLTVHGSARQELAPAVGADTATPPAAAPSAPHAVEPRTAVAPSAAVAPSPTRLQRYRASLELRVATPAKVSTATRRALAIARSLGGYPLAVDVDARGRSGYASLTLRIPRRNVQQAVTRLSALGTIVASDVRVEDLQAQVNATDTRIARLQRRLNELRAQEQTDDVKRQIESLTREVQRLQRARATTVKGAAYATVKLQVTTRKQAAAPPHEGPGPFHGLGVAFRWAGIVAVYALALAAPVVALAFLVWLAARAVRRRREDALLSAS